MSFDITFHFKGMDSTDAIKNYATEKSHKLEKYLTGSTVIKWNFELEHVTHRATCHLTSDSINDIAEAESEDLYKSIDFAIDKIVNQARKQIEKLKSHHHGK